MEDERLTRHPRSHANRLHHTTSAVFNQPEWSGHSALTTPKCDATGRRSFHIRTVACRNASPGQLLRNGHTDVSL